MKKRISAIAALALLSALSLTAFAADTEINRDSADKTGSTAVTFTVDPAYTVTIPETVTLTLNRDSVSDDDKYIGTGSITAGAVRLDKGAAVTVTVAGDFTLTSTEGAQLAYKAYVNGETAALTSGAVVIVFGTSVTAQSAALTYKAAEPAYAGVYSDTLTFTISAPAIGMD